MHVRCPHCRSPIELLDDSALDAVTCPSCGSNFSLVSTDATGTYRPDSPKNIGHFTLDERLGIGAFGTVWKATDTELDRTVAIKVPRKGQLDQEEAEIFLREARAAAQLMHPNIVSVHEVGRDEDTVFIVSDFVEGITLTDWLTGYQPPPREAAELCVQIADALHHAHQQGVIHRDLKPGNIMLDRGGAPHIMDFGLAKREAGEITMTVDGQVLGTPAYMSPEQARGESHNVDPRTDVYSLGVILFELLTGERPFRGNTRMLLHQLLTEEVPSPRKLSNLIPRDLETICLKCLEKDPQRRYESAEELQLDLRRYLDGLPIEARSVGRIERSWRWARRNPARAGLITSLSVLLLTVTIGSVVVALREAELRYELQLAQSQRAESHLDALFDAEIHSVAAIIENLKPVLPDFGPRLYKLLESSKATSDQRVRARLALLTYDPHQVEDLKNRSLQSDLDELLVIRAALRPYRSELIEPMWRQMSAEDTDSQRLLRIASLLADYDPENPGWAEVSSDVAFALVSESRLDVGRWTAIFLPVRNHLITPLRRTFQRAPSEEGIAASTILAELLADSPHDLVDLIRTGHPIQVSFLATKLADHGDRAVELLDTVLEEPSAPPPSWILSDLEEGIDWEVQRDELAKLHAKTAIAYFAIGRPDKFWTLLEFAPDPRLRSYLIHQFGEVGVDARILAGRMAMEPDVSVRRALLLALCHYSPYALNPRHREQFVNSLLNVYQSDPDPGIHSAAELLLRRWGEEERVQKALSSLREDDTRRSVASLRASSTRWYVNGQGQTLVVVPGPRDVVLGSPNGEHYHGPAEQQHRRHIGRTFAIAAKETTVEEFQRFNAEYRPHRWNPAPNCPVNRVSWLDAARYCRWLSEQEGIPEVQMCYPPIDDIQEGFRPRTDYLNRTGYRLPTEAEWEVACRAGATTPYCYGADPDLLKHYAWYAVNSNDRTHAVGTLVPNEFGLFDMHGNLQEWCDDRFAAFPLRPFSEVLNDEGDVEPVVGSSNRVWRDGLFSGHHSQSRAAYRVGYAPHDTNPGVGFRVARTVAVPAIDVIDLPARSLEQVELTMDGEGEFFVTAVQGDIEVHPSRFSASDAMIITAPDLHRRPWSLDLEQSQTDQSVTVVGPLSDWQSHAYMRNSTGMRMCWVPSGEFLMGSNAEDIAALISIDPSPYSDEQRDLVHSEHPQHLVEITRPYWISACEVTIGQFREFVAETGYETDAERDGAAAFGVVNGQWGELPPGYSWENPGYPVSDEHPVTIVTQRDVHSFCTWLSEREGRTYRLPTEAEWEYACRAGTATRWYFGNDADGLSQHAWYLDNSSGVTHPVGRKRPNSWGLFDVYGNVFELCADHFALDYYENSPRQDPSGPEAGEAHVARGYEIMSGWYRCRSAKRIGAARSSRGNLMGFRVVADATETDEKPELAVQITRDAALVNRTSFDIRGSGEFFIETVDDILVSPRRGVAPTEVHFDFPRGDSRQYSFVIRQPETGYELNVSRLLVSAEWDVSFYALVLDEGRRDDPPADWEGVTNSEPLDRWRTGDLDFMWGAGAPSGRVPADYFAVVATAHVTLPAGNYQFWTLSDDGVRVFVDNEKQMDTWTNRSHHADLVELHLESGSHQIRVEFYELTGHAELKFGILPLARDARRLESN